MKARPENTPLSPVDAEPSDAVRGEVRQVLVAFFTAWKSYTLFPEDNDICHTALTNLEAAFGTFLSANGSLRLDVEENSFAYAGKIVHQGIQDTEDLAFILYREGMRWLEFKAGVALPEITSCFRMLQDCRASDEDLVGELALALLDADLPHIDFETIVPVSDATPLLDLDMFDPHPHDPVDSDPGTTADDVDFASHGAGTPVSLDNVDPDRWKLTAEEHQKLKIMVLEAESRDDPDDFIHALLMVLHEQTDDEGFLTVAAPLEDEFLRALLADRFDLAETILRNFLQFRRDPEARWAWARPHVDAFLSDISSPETLNCLPDVWPTDPGEVEKLVRLLLLLPAEAIISLAPLVARLPTEASKSRVMSVLVALARKDLAPLRKIISLRDSALAAELVLVLGGMPGDEARDILVELLEHRSPAVRAGVIRALTARQRDVLEQLFPLIDDEDRSVAGLVYDYLGARRDPRAEALLLAYLKGRPFHRAARIHALSCYRALGLCGSKAAVPYLHETVLEETFLPDVSRSLHRQGAAVALNLLAIDEAHQALKEAAESRFSSVRLACRKAGEYEAEIREALT